MKWMIASDLHGSAYYCEQMLEAFEREGADRLLLLGDLLYHGPRNPQPRDYAPQKVMELLNARKERLFCVRGNCDSEVDQMVLEFPILADYALLTAGDRLVFATHGHVHNEQTPPPLASGSILLHGHTHLPQCTQHPTFACLNPGSISMPKEGSWHGYMTLEDDLFRWRDTEGALRREYRA